MKVISINVNGIRAAARKGLFEWLPTTDADVICLQETKAQLEQINDPLYHPENYYSHFHSAEKKGYSGVAIYTKQQPTKVYKGLGELFVEQQWSDIDSEGRYLQVDIGNISIVSLYMPSGSSKEERQTFKYDMMARLEPVLKSMSKKRREYIICGDWNIAHKKIDIKNWRGNQKNSGFLPEERAWMDWLLDDPDNTRDDALGFHDAFRLINQQAHQYTWWSNRGQAWANNTGWRIDYQIISKGLKDKVIEQSDVIYKEQRFSDHAPLIIEYDI